MKKQFLFYAALIALNFTPCGLSAKTWRVNRSATLPNGANVGGTAVFPVFQEISTAINNAAVLVGDTIHVEGSALVYSAFILNKSLSIIGPGYFLTQNPQVSATGLSARVDQGFTVSTSNCSISGLTLSGGWYASIVGSSNVKIERCYFVDTPLQIDGSNAASSTSSNILIQRNYFGAVAGITGYSTQFPSAITIRNNIFRSALQLPSQLYVAVVNNNIFDVTGTSGNQADITCGEFKNNIIMNALMTLAVNAPSSGITHNIVAAVTQLSGTANLIVLSPAQQLSDLFNNPAVASPDARYLLKTAYITGNSGSDATQRGIFGGPMPYQLSGVGPVPLIYSISTTGVATPASGLPITISSKTINN